MTSRTLQIGWSCAILCLLWIALGLTGHEPWKPGEAYTFGLVLHMLHSGDWVVPTLGGEPFMEKPPAFFVTAALFAKLAGGWLPLHDAARLATGAYLGLTLLFVSLTASELGPLISLRSHGDPRRHASEAAMPSESDWNLIWQGGRPGDRHETYQLFHRVNPAP